MRSQTRGEDRPRRRTTLPLPSLDTLAELPGLLPAPRQWHDQATARAARRIATAAAYGGGGLTLLGAAGAGLLLAEATLAKRLIEPRMQRPPDADGWYGPDGRVPERVGEGDGAMPGEALVLGVLGDSAAAGMGADEPESTPGALLAAGLARLADRPVSLHRYARVGAVSAELAGQVERMLADGVTPDAVLVVVGGNDVTRRVPPVTAVRELADCVARLRRLGAQVVVGTCPDLGTVTPVPQPLRALGRRWSRQLAAAQTIGVLEAGGRTVSLADLLGPDFYAEPDVMFADDRFHPSGEAYRRATTFLLPPLAAALDLLPPTSEPEGDGVVTGAAEAAAEAAEHPGTEVAGATVSGQEHGSRGRWVRLLRRPALPLGRREPAG